MNKRDWTTKSIEIPIPEEDMLAVIRIILIERLKTRMYLIAQIFDGGETIKGLLK